MSVCLSLFICIQSVIYLLVNCIHVHAHYSVCARVRACVRACVLVDNLEPFDIWCFNSQNINYMSSKTKALLIIFELNLIEIVYGTTQ